jgi:hypothetical protein
MIRRSAVLQRSSYPAPGSAHVFNTSGRALRMGRSSSSSEKSSPWAGRLLFLFGVDQAPNEELDSSDERRRFFDERESCSDR